MSDGFCKLISHAGLLLHASWSLFKWAVGEGLPFTQRLSGIIRDLGCGEFDLRLLLLSQIGRRPVSRKSIKEVLFILLIDGSRKRVKGREDMVAYGECLLSGWRESSRQSDAVELC